MNEQDRSTHGNETTFVEIRIKGHLDVRWADWFADLTITPQENGDTLLTGPVADQAALHGLLRNVRDLGCAAVGYFRCGGAKSGFSGRARWLFRVVRWLTVDAKGLNEPGLEQSRKGQNDESNCEHELWRS